MDERDAARRRIAGQLKGRASSQARAERMRAAARDSQGASERVAIRETEDGLGIHVPVPRNTPLSLFLVFWLACWGAGEWFAISEILRGGFGVTDIFLAFWLVIWTVAGLGTAAVLFWQFVGRERLFITGGAVVVESGLPFRAKSRIFRKGEAVNFRRASPSLFGGTSTSAKGIAYDAGGHTQYFGAGLTSLEVSSVLAAIERHLPEAVAKS